MRADARTRHRLIPSLGKLDFLTVWSIRFSFNRRPYPTRVHGSAWNAPITIGQCPVEIFKAPHCKTQLFGRVYEPKDDVIVGPNVRAQPVISVTRTLGFDSSGHSHTLLMSRDTTKSRHSLMYDIPNVTPRIRAENGVAALISPRAPRMPLTLPALLDAASIAMYKE